MSTRTPNSPPTTTEAGGGRRPRRRRWWLFALIGALAIVIVVVGAIGAFVFIGPQVTQPSCTKAVDPSRSGAISQYCPSGYQLGDSLAFGSDGTVWFTANGGKVARMTPQSGAVTAVAAPIPPSAVADNGLVRGGDGNIWYIANDKLGRVTMSGQVTEVALPSELGLARTIVTGPDGTLWVTMSPNDPAKPGGLLSISTTGAAAGVPVLAKTLPPSSGMGGPAWAGAPDGSLWIPTTGSITRITRTGSTTQIPVDIPGVAALTAGPDGTMWFINSQGRAGRITLTGATTYFSGTGIGTTENISTVSIGPDGNLWFSDQPGGSGRIGRITPAGAVTTFSVPSAESFTNITAGSDGGVWFMSWYASGAFGSPQGRITRITP